MNQSVSKGIQIEIVTIVWTLIEATVSLSAGIVACSALLTAFGIDSIIEIITAAVLTWRLYTEAKQNDIAITAKAEQIANWIVAIALLLLCFYVLITSVYGLYKHILPDASLPGIIVSLCAVIIMPYLARSKKRIAKEIGSKALAGDAACSMVCAYMAGAVLSGLILSYLFHWWWAEHIAGLLFLYWLYKETREAFEAARNKDHTCNCG